MHVRTRRTDTSSLEFLLNCQMCESNKNGVVKMSARVTHVRATNSTYE
jgi:hypothetical protein